MKKQTKKKRKGLEISRMHCPYCGATVVYRSADGIYRDNRSRAMLYVCSHYPQCDAYVRVHAGTNIPVGTLANQELRTLRRTAHHYFDQLYQSGMMSKQDAYQWLAELIHSPLSEQGYFTSFFAMNYDAEYPDINISRHISAVDGASGIDYMIFKDTKSAADKYNSSLNEDFAWIIKNDEKRLESSGSKSNFQYYKLETDKHYVHIMRIGNTIVSASSPIESRNEIVSVLDKLGYNYDILFDKTGYIGSKQFTNSAMIFFAVSLPICFLCRRLYLIKLCEVCGKEFSEVKYKMAEFLQMSSVAARTAGFEEWIYRETTDKIKAKKLMFMYKYSAFPSLLFLILAIGVRNNGTYNGILLTAVVFISVLLIYSVIFFVKNYLIKFIKNR